MLKLSTRDIRPMPLLPHSDGVCSLLSIISLFQCFKTRRVPADWTGPIRSQCYFKILTIARVLAKYSLTLSSSFIPRSSNSLRRVCNCALFTLEVPFYFYFMESQIPFVVSLLRMVLIICLSIAWKR